MLPRSNRALMKLGITILYHIPTHVRIVCTYISVKKNHCTGANLTRNLLYAISLSPSISLLNWAASSYFLSSTALFFQACFSPRSKAAVSRAVNACFNLARYSVRPASIALYLFASSFSITSTISGSAYIKKARSCKCGDTAVAAGISETRAPLTTADVPRMLMPTNDTYNVYGKEGRKGHPRLPNNL